MSRPDSYFFGNAIRDLRAAGLNVVKTAYGFSLTHTDAAGTYEGTCGIEQGGELSLSLRLNGSTVRWFIRPSLPEIADLLASSYAGVRTGRFTSLGEAMVDADERAASPPENDPHF